MNNLPSLEQKRELAWEMYQTLRQSVVTQAFLFIDIGKKLKDIRDDKLYKYLGEGGYSTFQHFLANPELGLRPSTSYLYIRLYEYYIEQLQITREQLIEIPINRLMRLLPSLKEMPDDEARETITDLGQLTSYDYDIEVVERNIEKARPKLFRNKENGMWKFEFDPESMESIVNTQTGEVLYGSTDTIKPND